MFQFNRFTIKIKKAYEWIFGSNYTVRSPCRRNFFNVSAVYVNLKLEQQIEYPFYFLNFWDVETTLHSPQYSHASKSPASSLLFRRWSLEVALAYFRRWAGGDALVLSIRILDSSISWISWRHLRLPTEGRRDRIAGGKHRFWLKRANWTTMILWIGIGKDWYHKFDYIIKTKNLVKWNPVKWMQPYLLHSKPLKHWQKFP